MISRARWHQIQSLFEQLIDTGTGERSARLASACGDDLDLHASVESLLESDGRHEDVLLQAIGEAAESLLEDHQDRLIGTRVGPYRVVAILGHGGMSPVYPAARDDSQYPQTPALHAFQHATRPPR